MSTKVESGPIITKISKERFKEEFYDLIAELTSDKELMVRIEGIDMYIEYNHLISKSEFEKDFVPYL